MNYQEAESILEEEMAKELLTIERWGARAAERILAEVEQLADSGLSNQQIRMNSAAHAYLEGIDAWVEYCYEMEGVE